MATITVNPAVSYQTMRGWQVSGDTGIIEYIDSADHATWTDAVLDDNIALGINAPRIGIHSGMAETDNDRYGTFLANGQDKVTGSGVTLWQAVKDNWRVPVNDDGDPDSINASGFKWSMVDQQMDKIIVPMKAKLAARGETMFWMITFIHFSLSNQLHADADEYAELMLATWNHLNATYGFVPPALEIWLEPDNDACQITPAEMAAIIVATRDRLVGAGYSKPIFVAPSTVAGSAARQFYLDIKTASATAANYIDIISYHRYGAIDNTQLAALRATADADGKELAMNEYGGADMRDLYNDLAIGQNTMWEQYALGFYDEGDGDDGYKHFEVTGTLGSGPFTRTLMKRSKYLQHYYKYIRAGAVMKGVTNSDGNHLGLAFENSNGTYAVATKHAGSASITVSGLPAGTYGIRYTEGDYVNEPSAYDQALSNQTIGAGQDVVFTMPGAGVSSVFDINYLAAGEPGSSVRLSGVAVSGASLT